MQRSRFLFVESVARSATLNPPDGRMRWFLVSPNNRQLGQDVAFSKGYSECRAAAVHLKQIRTQLKQQIYASERDGLWVWRLSLDGVPMATACRSYLRVRECEYNVSRFLVALEEADIVDGVRRVGAGGRGISRPASLT